MPKTVTLRIDDKLLDRFKHHAEMENRSISNFIETATLRYIEETELVDEFEMSEILHNDKLLRRLKKGSEDARKKRGRFV
ncbi:MAG: CopG family transcriptional regulator [Spirochaetes bacterium RBG_13_51_14]|nr:MAG: CopG family transcriptional regulator [Spirochaetes bacterium RBG_13_51_14]